MIIKIVFSFSVILLNSQFLSSELIDKSSKLKNIDEKEWFVENIPFVEVPDKQIEEVYYYRWSSHKRHLRYTAIGSGYAVTEFVHDVGYGKKFGEINAAGGHQIYESRWLKNQRYVKVSSLIVQGYLSSYQ